MNPDEQIAILQKFVTDFTPKVHAHSGGGVGSGRGTGISSPTNTARFCRGLALLAAAEAAIADLSGRGP